MNLIEEHKKKYAILYEITGEAMRVHAKYKYGLLESAYQAALKYLLELKGFKVDDQVSVPMYWEDVKLDKSYRLDLVINQNIIIELKATNGTGSEHRRQLLNYMNLTHLPFGMILNFGMKHLYFEWYVRDEDTGEIEKIERMERPAS